MPLDLLVTTLFLGTVAVALRGGPYSAASLPPLDRPPALAMVPLPRGPRRLRRYVGRGLTEIDAFLSVPEDLLPGPADRPSEPDEFA